MTYEEAMAYIVSLQPLGWRLGLDRMQEFVRRAGLQCAVDGSERRYVHVAGTNGKGSVVAYLQSILHHSGVKVGAYFSPYVYEPRERIQLGDSLINPQEMGVLTEELKQVAEGMEGGEFSGVTEFEFKTGLGFLYWHRRSADWVALETGLGGRLDATNVVTPAASIVVSIGLDHQAILGHSLAEIAAEKAGILKPGKPAIMGQMPAEAAAVIEARASELACPLWRFGKEIKVEEGVISTPAQTFSGLKAGIGGVWQVHNLALAIAGLNAAGMTLDLDSVRVGAARAHAPGRFQQLTSGSTTFILDGAHNPDSARALARSLEREFPGRRPVFVTNMLQGHDAGSFYCAFDSLAAEAIVPPIDFVRARDPAEVALAIEQVGINATVAASVEEAIQTAKGAGDLIVVTGSYYLVGEVGRLLGLSG